MEERQANGPRRKIDSGRRSGGQMDPAYCLPGLGRGQAPGDLGLAQAAQGRFLPIHQEAEAGLGGFYRRVHVHHAFGLQEVLLDAFRCGDDAGIGGPRRPVNLPHQGL